MGPLKSLIPLNPTQWCHCLYGQESPGWISLYKLVTFFFFWKYTETSIFLEKLIGQWIPNRNGRGIAREIKKKYFHFQNLTKNGNKVWTISVLHFFLLKIYRIINFFGKNWLINEFGTAVGRGLLEISKKIISIFKIWQKMVTKLGQFKQLKCPNFVNCPNFVIIFCRVLKMKIFFFLYPSQSLALCGPEFIDQSIDVSVYFHKKKLTSLNRDIHPGDSWPHGIFFCEKSKFS